MDRARLVLLIALSGCATAGRSDGAHRFPICEEVEPPPADSRVVEPLAELADRMTPPVKLSGPDPFYAAEAIEHRVQGTLLVACNVMTNGCAMGCHVVRSLPYMDAPVVDALRRRRYGPATLDGKPVNVRYVFKITLRLPQY